MKNLSRLTALLLALMMLFTSMPAFATESEAIPVDEFEAADYASLLSIAEEDAAATADASWGNIFDGMPCADDNVYCQNVLHMLECPNAQERYEYLNTLYSEDGVDLEFTMLHYYYYHVEDQENMTDSVVCTCSFPMFEPEYVPGDVSMHDKSCPWHFKNLSLAEQYDVIRDLDADAQAPYKETLSTDALETLNRVNVSEYENGNVAISVPEGAFTEDYLLEVEGVTEQTAIADAINTALAADSPFEVMGISANDISFLNLTNMEEEMQPKSAVGLTFDIPAAENDDVIERRVYHMVDNGDGTFTAELVGTVGAGATTLDVSAQNFSIYVVSSVGTEDGTPITANSTVTLNIGESQVYYWTGDTSNSGGYATGYTWTIDDGQGIVDWTVYGAGSSETNPEYGTWPNEAYPYIKVTAKAAGTVTVTMKYFYNNAEQKEIFYIKVPETSFYISDQVAVDGTIVPAGSSVGTWGSDVEYVWTRSDGETIKAIALVGNGVNVALDRGGITQNTDGTYEYITYTVTAKNADGDTLGDASYTIPYGNEILNDSFETPVIAANSHIQIPNGTKDFFWKTTGVGSGGAVARDIELASSGDTNYGSDRVTIKARNGNQFAEVNAEAFGTLYQDILTAPGATLTWSFSHAARYTSGSNNTLYVVIASTEGASKVIDKDDVEALLNVAKVSNVFDGAEYSVTIDGVKFNFRIWKDVATWKTTDYWNDISGTYKVPEGQYLTRLFFASETSGGGSTQGNLIDAIGAEETLKYKIMYYVDNKLRDEDTQDGTQNVYTYVTPSKLNDYLKDYALTGVTINGVTYPGDVTAAGFYIAPYLYASGDAEYPNIFRLYFKDRAITVTKQVTVSNWSELNATKQLALMNGYKAKFGLYDAGDNLLSEVEVPITYVEGQDLIALAEFSTALDGTALKLENGTYTVKEISAPELTGYALSTSYPGASNGYPTVTIDEDNSTANVTCLNAYTFKKGALTITKNVTDGAFPAEGKTFTFTVTPADGQDLYTWLAKNDYAESGGGFVVTVDVGATKTASVTLSDLPAGNYNVVETADERYNTTYQVGSAAATTTSAEANVTQNGEANVIVTNTAKTGELTITKVVKDSTFTEGSRTFNFTVAGGSVTKTGSITVNAANKATASANTVLITDLPVGTYTVTETNAAELGYAPTYDKTQVTIEAGGKETVNVVNTASAKIDINVTKVWEDYNNLTNTRPVEITVNLVASYAAANDSALVSAPSGSTAADPWTHTFENVEKFDPNGNLITYSVTENEITGELYNDPAITGDVDKGFQIVNTLKPGSLEVTKTVVDEVTTDGATPDSAQAFTFAVTLKHNGSDLTGVTYTVDGGEAQTFKGTITLTNGQKATFANLPAGTVYTVTETNIPVGFEVDQPEKTGNVAANKVSTAAFTNTFKVGDLKITKTVTGADAPSADTFTFTVKSDNIPAGTYGGVEFKAQTDDASTTDVDESKFVVATVVINTNSGSGTKTITGLPKGATFTVTEAGDADYELTSSTGTTGTIVENAVKEATFTNTYQFASLTIEKKGILPIDHHAKDGTNEKESQSTIFNVKGNGVDMNVVINGNDSVTIKHLPVGDYTVTEDETWSWRYSADKAEQSVTVNPTGENKVTFNNSRDEIYWLSGDCYAENNFGAFGTATN